MRSKISKYLLFIFLFTSVLIPAQKKDKGKDKRDRKERSSGANQQKTPSKAKPEISARKKRKLDRKEARTRRRHDREERRMVKAHHKRIQTKETRKRMRRTKKKSEAYHENRRPGFFKRLFKKRR